LEKDTLVNEMSPLIFADAIHADNLGRIGKSIYCHLSFENIHKRYRRFGKGKEGAEGVVFTGTPVN